METLSPDRVGTTSVPCGIPGKPCGTARASGRILAFKDWKPSLIDFSQKQVHWEDVSLLQRSKARALGMGSSQRQREGEVLGQGHATGTAGLGDPRTPDPGPLELPL